MAGARYERLNSRDDSIAASRPRRFCFKKMNGRGKGLRLFRSRKLNWKPFSIMIFPRRIAAVCAAFVKGMKMEDLCPGVIFSCQWGLPVISHSSALTGSRRHALYLERALGYC